MDYKSPEINLKLTIRTLYNTYELTVDNNGVVRRVER